LNPMDSPAPVAEMLNKRGDDVILVGHLPFMEKLASLIVTGKEDPPVVAFQRGGMVCVEEGVGCRRILWTLFPDQPGAPGGKKES
jgi:phosphohistidine phosphatase